MKKIVAVEIVSERIIKTEHGFKVDHDHYYIRVQRSSDLMWMYTDFKYPRDHKGYIAASNRADYIASINSIGSTFEIPVFKREVTI